ncbi:MAG: glycosyltransferase [Ginsengibacter sp.]
MHNRFRIGVVIAENYRPEVGGGFGYYESLVNAIDNYEFNPLLEFVFIRFSETTTPPFRKEFIQFKFNETIAPVKHYNKRIAQLKIIPISIITKLLVKKYENRIHLVKKSKLEEWLVQQKIDLVYHIAPGSGELNFPFVTTHWDIGHYSTFAFPEVSMNGTFEGREKLYSEVHKKALAVFCESESGKKELFQYKQINAERIFIVPLFPGKLVHLEISPREQQSIIENQFSLKKGNYFLYPAQFWSHKNHYNLLLAFKKVNDIYAHLKLVLPGSDKGNLDYIKEVIVNLDLGSSVLLPGFISNEALYSLNKNAIAMVMPTLLGPTNMPLLEAAYLGCPVITSSFDGHKEILGDYATYVDPLDEKVIAEAMIQKYETREVARNVFKNDTNKIETAIKAIEKHFLKLRKIRNTWGYNFHQY